LNERRNEYNYHRLHGGIGWQTPAAYAVTLDEPMAGRSRTHRMLTLRSGLRPSLRLSKHPHTRRCSHIDWHKNREMAIGPFELSIVDR